MKAVLVYILLACVTLSAADQPIMNMMPRWDGGYGWQALYERMDRDDLLREVKPSGRDGMSALSNCMCRGCIHGIARLD